MWLVDDDGDTGWKNGSADKDDEAGCAIISKRAMM